MKTFQLQITEEDQKNAARGLSLKDLLELALCETMNMKDKEKGSYFRTKIIDLIQQEAEY